MIDLFHEYNERSDIALTQSTARVVLFELFNEPARIINTNLKLIAGLPQKCARKLAQFAGRSSRQDRQLRTTRAIDQAIFQVDPDLRIGALKQSLDLAEERLVHKLSDGRPAIAGSSRLSN